MIDFNWISYVIRNQHSRIDLLPINEMRAHIAERKPIMPLNTWLHVLSVQYSFMYGLRDKINKKT